MEVLDDVLCLGFFLDDRGLDELDEDPVEDDKELLEEEELESELELKLEVVCLEERAKGAAKNRQKAQVQGRQADARLRRDTTKLQLLQNLSSR